MAADFSEVNDRSKEEQCREIYDKQSRRIYSLALWMTASRMAAQRLVSRTFLRALAFAGRVGTEQVDQAFLAEVRDLTTVEAPALEVTAAPASQRIHGNV